MSLNLWRRGGAYLYSADTLTWYVYPEVPVLDPAVRGIPVMAGGPERQVHDTVVFPYAGYYLALYQNQHNADIQDIELAVSRDGETFVYIQPGVKVLPVGREGEWDCEYLIPTVPVVLDEEIRIYYGGGRRVELPREDQARLGKQTLVFLPGLASLRRDGFTCMALQNSASAGVFSTIPFRLDESCGLALNALCSSEHTLRVEVLEAATDRTLAGYSREENIAVKEDGLSIPIRWQSAVELPAGIPVRLRFGFEGYGAMPRLYSYRFTR